MKARCLLSVLVLTALGAAVFLFFRGGQKEPALGSREAFRPVSPALAAAFSGKNAFAHVEAICAIGPRPSASEGYEKALTYLEVEFARQGWKTFRQRFTAATPRGPIGFTNLIARHASAPADEARSTPVVIAGHLDSKLYEDFEFIGANDGASSTGVILELARVLSSDPASAASVELVLFDGEEAMLPNITPTDGLYGSKYYAHQLTKRTTWPSVGIVLDLIGDPQRELFHNPEAPEPFVLSVTEAAREFDAPLRRAPGPIIDDHIPLQNGGLPCLHLIGDFMNMPYWHKPGDTLEVISPEALEKAGRITLRFLSSMAPSE